MDQADFVHMVRMSEHASAHDSRAYRRSVAAFAAQGYVVLGGMSAFEGAATTALRAAGSSASS